MKKQLILAIALFISITSFAQKKELKTLAKAVKSNNYAEAKTVISQLEPMLSSMDDKSKAKYFLNKGKAFFANGAGSGDDVSVALESLSKISGKDFLGEITELKRLMQNDLLTKANDLYIAKDFIKASAGFDKLFSITEDQSYLYYAAISAIQGQDMDLALKHYLKLDTLGYTGVETQYFATSVASGKEEILDKSNRDLFVKAKTHVSPGERQTESKVGEITKNIALIYINKGETDKALASMKKARAENPDNVDLIIQEANLYLKLKDDVKFKALMKEAVEKNPNNAVLHYNIGVISMKNKDFASARESFNKALSVDATHTDAALNLSTSYIDEGNSLIEQMNALGSSNADNIKYDELKAEKARLFNVGAKTLEAFITNNADVDKNIAKQLYNIYNALGDSDKASTVKSKFGL